MAVVQSYDNAYDWDAFTPATSNEADVPTKKDGRPKWYTAYFFDGASEPAKQQKSEPRSGPSRKEQRKQKLQLSLQQELRKLEKDAEKSGDGQKKKRKKRQKEGEGGNEISEPINEDQDQPEEVPKSSSTPLAENQVVVEDTSTSDSVITPPAHNSGPSDLDSAPMVARGQAAKRVARMLRHPIVVDVGSRKKRTVFVGNVPLSYANPSKIRELFRGCGILIEVRFIARENPVVQDQNMIRKMCFCEFDSTDSCRKACGLNGLIVDSCALRINMSDDINERKTAIKRRSSNLDENTDVDLWSNRKVMKSQRSLLLERKISQQEDENEEGEGEEGLGSSERQTTTSSRIPKGMKGASKWSHTQKPPISTQWVAGGSGRKGGGSASTRSVVSSSLSPLAQLIAQHRN